MVLAELNKSICGTKGLELIMFRRLAYYILHDQSNMASQNKLANFDLTGN